MKRAFMLVTTMLLAMLVIVTAANRVDAASYLKGGDRYSKAPTVNLGKTNTIKIDSVGYGRYFKFKTTKNTKVSYRITATSNLMADEMDYGYYCMTLYDSYGNEVGSENTWDVKGHGRPVNRDFNLKKNTTYYLCVHGIVECDDIAVDSELKISEIVGKPARVSITKLKQGKRAAQVSWKKVSYAKKYEIQYRLSGTSKWNKKITTKNNCVINKLKKNKTYQIRIRAVRVVNGRNYYGAWSIVKRIKIKR